MYEFEKIKLKKYLGDTVYQMLKKYDCIIAGGSILSIFNNTEINDIDIYFRNKEDLASFLYNEMSDKWII